MPSARKNDVRTSLFQGTVRKVEKAASGLARQVKAPSGHCQRGRLHATDTAVPTDWLNSLNGSATRSAS